MARTDNSIIVESKAFSLKALFADKYTVDFYQREYVWDRKQIEDLIMDLSTEFMKQWEPDHVIKDVSGYDPYFMGEIVLSTKNGEKSAVIDGQQRITTLTLLLIYLLRIYKHLPQFPATDVNNLIYSNSYGELCFNLDIPERQDCMYALYQNGEYSVPENARPSIVNLVNRYSDIAECWDKRIDDNNVVLFTYWIMEKVIFSKVWTNSDEFAYVIFETMNDRGLSLTQVEMLRSYLLANIDVDSRSKAMEKFDRIIRELSQIKLSSKSKAEFEFFKMYFRGHYAEDLSQGNNRSDFVRIGKEFHRWVSDNAKKLNLDKSSDFVAFVDRIEYFAKVYQKINTMIQERDTLKYLYLIVNSDYGFTMQPAIIMSAVHYGDSDSEINEKIKVISKYLTKVLTFRVWNHWQISQSAMDSRSYELCKAIRGMDFQDLKKYLIDDPLQTPALEYTPTLNQQNRWRLTVMLSLITEIVARNSNEPDYPLNHPNIEIEHIWANHYEDHPGEFQDKAEFDSVRNCIGDLMVLPKSFNASYGDSPYGVKVEQYFSQNILAQSLNEKKYTNNPGFIEYVKRTGIPFKPYVVFTRESINERMNLYRKILEEHWKH